MKKPDTCSLSGKSLGAARKAELLNRRQFTGLMAAGSSGILRAESATTSPAVKTRASRPNILLLMADQQTAKIMGAYGNRLVQTPATDELGLSGFRFENFFVQVPLCAPSRACFLTGRYVHGHDVRINPNSLRDGIPTLTAVLGGSGYQTAAIGHIHRKQLCRDFEVADESMMAVWSRARDEKVEELIPRFGSTNFFMHGTIDLKPEQDFDGQVTEKGVEFLENRDRNRPFFLNLAYLSPHPPYFVVPPFDRMYDPESIPLPPRERAGADKPPEYLQASREMGGAESRDENLQKCLAHYYGMVTYLDDQVAKIIGYLREEGLYERTILIYTSDHGDYVGTHGMVAKTCSCYDPLLHVPLAVRVPGLGGGKVINSLLESVDLMPSILELVGLECPDSVHGSSFVPLFEGGTWCKQAVVYAETGGYPLPHTTNAPNGMPASGRIQDIRSMVRTEYWKLTYRPGALGELYDLDKDPDELVNLYRRTGYREKTEELKEELLNWKIRTS